MESSPVPAPRLTSIDLLRGVVMLLMALDHVRMFFGYGTWYAAPTDLATTTALLFFTRWITHFCAPAFVFLAGTSAFLVGMKKEHIKELSGYLLTRGLWLIFAELLIVNFAWTFDITYSFIILQVIWAIGISMMILSALVFLPIKLILAIGLVLVFGHNLLDGIRLQGNEFSDIAWYMLHQPQTVSLGGRLVNIAYPTLPWIGLMALGYVSGALYQRGFPPEQRRRTLLTIGICATVLFLLLREFNLYGEPTTWNLRQASPFFTVMAFLNTTKYPPSLQFLLMTMGPALVFLSLVDSIHSRASVIRPVLTFGRVPFFFYIIHLYLIHALAMLWLAYSGRDWHEYILSIGALRSGRLSDFGLGLSGVYLVWILVIALLYPICRWYQKYKETNPSHWWLRFL
jgi:uncharacterized membrane protein